MHVGSYVVTSEFKFIGKLCITNSYVTTSEFTILHISCQNLHHTFKSIVEFLRNSFNFFTIVVSVKITHSFATIATRFTVTWHVLFGDSGHTISHFGEKVDDDALGVSELLCKKNWIKRCKIGEAGLPPVIQLRGVKEFFTPSGAGKTPKVKQVGVK